MSLLESLFSPTTYYIGMWYYPTDPNKTNHICQSFEVKKKDIESEKKIMLSRFSGVPENEIIVKVIETKELKRLQEEAKAERQKRQLIPKIPKEIRLHKQQFNLSDGKKKYIEKMVEVYTNEDYRDSDILGQTINGSLCEVCDKDFFFIPNYCCGQITSPYRIKH